VPEAVLDVGELANGSGRYRRLLAVPGSRALTAADLCARLPQGMLSVTVLLVVAQHASMRAAGFALAGSTVGLAVTAPVRGRFADRYGVARTAVVCSGGYLAAWAGLVAACAARAPAAALVALAAATGSRTSRLASPARESPGRCGPLHCAGYFSQRHSSTPRSAPPRSP
jgi:MFS family permease